MSSQFKTIKCMRNDCVHHVSLWDPGEQPDPLECGLRPFLDLESIDSLIYYASFCPDDHFKVFMANKTFHNYRFSVNSFIDRA